MTADVTQVTVVGETTVIGISGSVTAPVVAVNVNAIPVVEASITAIPQVTVSAGIQGPPGTGGTSDFPSRTGNNGKYLTTDGTAIAWASVSNLVNGDYSLVLGVDGTINLPLATNGKGVIQTTGDYYFDANGAIYNLGQDGTLTLPIGGTITDSRDSPNGITPAIYLKPYGGDTVTQELAIYAETGNKLFLSTSDYTSTSLYLGSDAQYVGISSDGNVYIATTNHTNQWTFGSDGKLTVPGSIVFSNATTQTTAYTDSRAKGLLSITTNSASGTGSLSYNNTSGVFTFTPADLSGFVNTTAMNSAISTAINNLINSAPGTLDTLGEIATLLQTDTTAIGTITTTLAGKIGLSNLSVTTNSASGSGSLSYNNTSGVFTFTPPVIPTVPTYTITTGSASGGGALSLTGSTFTFNPATVYTLPTATTSILGGVKVDGTTISITNGVITAVSSAPALTVTTNAASGGGTLSYSAGVINFAPANVSLYAPLAGATFSGNIAMGSNYITGLHDPINPQDAATKAYVDASTAGLNIHQSVQALADTTNTAIAASSYTAGTTDASGGLGIGAKLTDSTTGTVLVVDSYTVQYNDRVLVSTFTGANLKYNGIYVLSTVGVLGNTKWVLTRAVDDNDSIAGQIVAGDFAFVSNGSIYKSSGWVQSSTGTSTNPVGGIKIGTDAITWSQFSGAGTYLAGSGITLTGNTFSLTNSNYITLTNLSITTASASGSGSLSYNNTSGVFTFTPAAAYSLTSSGIQTAFGSSLTQNYVYAAPNGTTGSASFRALVAADIPTIAYSSLSGTPTIPAAATWPVTNTNGASGPTKIAIGTNAGATSQGVNTVAIGNSAGNSGQGGASVSIGFGAGNSGQGNSAIAIGLNAGSSSQGAYSIAIGSGAGSALTNAQAARTIILNASGSDFDGVASQTDSFYVAPIRTDATPSNVLYYNTTTKEVTYGTAPVNYTLPTATTSVLGGVKVDGTTITITNGVISGANTYTLPTASTTVLGGVKIDGTTVTLNGSNQLVAAQYTLPTATTSVLGGVKVDGTTITINGSGVISGSSSYSLPTATTTVLGGVKVDGTTITINGSGVISSSGGGTTLPSQSGNNGKYLTTDGSTLSWATVAGGGSGATLANDTTDTVLYPTMSTSQSGSFTTANTSLGLTYNATTSLLNINQESINGTGMNLIYPSQGFSATYWTVSALTVTANSILAPDGTTTGATFTGSGASGGHSIYGIATYTAAGFLNSTNLSRTISCYFQKGTNNFVQLAVNSTDVTVYANFDLNSGVLGTVGAGCTATITAVPNYAGWYRCTMTWTAATISNVYMFLISTATAVRAESNTLSTTIYAWGMQCEYGPTARTYQATTNAYVYGTPALQINNNNILSLDTTGILSLGGNIITTTVGSLSTTINIANGLTSTTAQSVSIATGTNSGTKTINIGTGGGGANITLGATVSGTTIVNSSTIQGAATTQNVFNTVATTLNFAGAAQALAIGSTAAGSITTLNAPTVIGSNTTQNLYNTVATTVNEFGAATTINVATSAASATTWTLGNPNNSNSLVIAGGTSSGTDSISTTITTGTMNVFTGVVTGGTINIGGAGSNTVIGGILTTSTSTTTNAVNITYTPASALGSAIQATGKDTIGGTGYFDFFKATNTTSGVTNPNKTLRLTSTGNIQIVNSAYTATLLDIDDSGNTTIAGNLTINGINAGYAPNRPAFRVFGNSNTGWTPSSPTGGILTGSQFTVDYNQGSYLNTTSGVFTAPVAGLYQVNLTARTNSNSSGTGSAIQIQKVSGGTTTTQVYLEWAANTTANHIGGSNLVKMAANDTLKLVVSTGTVNFDANDNWSVAYIG